MSHLAMKVSTRVLQAAAVLSLLSFAGAASAQAQSEFLSVCERTAPVKAFIETKLAKACADITEDDLATLLRVAVPDAGITEFKVGDFSGLPNLEILNIKGNPFTSLPEGLFAGLTNLKTLVIFRTKLEHLPHDFLDGMVNLENIHAFSNPFRTISESVFQRLQLMPNLQAVDFNDALNEAEKTRLRTLFPETGPVVLAFF